MKYIIFKRSSIKIPVIIPECATHADVKMEDHEVVSAGFFSIDSNGYVVQDVEAKSLGMSPKEGDDKLIQSLLSNAGIYAFLDVDDL